MSFLKRLFGGEGAPGAGPNTEHAVLIRLLVTGAEGERATYHALRDAMSAAVARAGTLQGDDWGADGYTVVFHGPDAEAMWDAIMPAIERVPLPHGSVALKRYGGPGSRAEEVRLGWDG